ncbi:acyl-CoA dehydratase activase [Eggerthella sp. YY7918]|uniref:acyl-CoA dehydratase activase n=1 Tax=Eggerthella sp. (strain YY7918) TaxID=502558 RepID=UPI0002171763|nr:acyl-CoA dehydratase activase [Eggerthella sp. YY7918]BAK43963.1 hypothetical protein EGYY_07660 [Eggerthella sp. YY7918]
MEATFFLGIDSGSTASKCVIVNEQGDIVSSGLFSQGAGTAGPSAAVEKALVQVGITRNDIVKSCATGYGRNLVDWADDQKSELSCHAKGAAKLFSGARTIIDIGGQDAKVLSVDSAGRLEQFVMNDKCAAGTGRFLDVMASVFGVKVSDLADLDARSTKVAPISSTCTVFAESEVISKLAAGEEIPDIVAGVHTSVVERIYGLAKRLGVKPQVAMTGGVALNAGLCRRLEERLGYSLMTSELSQLCGALGAALFARGMQQATQG